MLTVFLVFFLCVKEVVNINNYERKEGKKPNIVFILTDDQDVVLGGMVSLEELEIM